MALLSRALLAVGLLSIGTLLLPPAHAAAASHQVTMELYAYSPTSLSVSQGDTVTWTNKDVAKHDVVVRSGPVTFRSPLLAKGQSWSFTFDTAGTYSYVCSIHPDMRASVTVRPAAVQSGPVPTSPSSPTSQPSASHRTHESQGPPTVRTPTKVTEPARNAAAAPVITSLAPVPQPGEASLNPLLLVLGFSTAVVVFCLLLLASRPTET